MNNKSVELTWDWANPIRQPEPPKDVFILTMEFMHGDADEDSEEEIKFPADDEQRMEDLKNLLIAIDWFLDYKSKYHNDAIGKTPLDSLDWQKYSKEKDRIYYYEDYFPSDIFSDGCYPASLQSYKLVYYSFAGIPHKVTVNVKS